MTDQFDTETRAAVAALVHRLKHRGNGSPADDEALAREYVGALKDRGWWPPLTAPEDAEGDCWGELIRWAVARTAGRSDWDPVTLLGVIHGCRNAGVAYEDAEAVLWRIARTGDDHRDFAELKDLTRNARHKSGGVPATEEFRAGLAALKARTTGPMPRLTDDTAPPGAA